MAKANRFVKNDEGVSAVIGVILMVAITVILAAVIAAFVFQLSSNVPKNKQVGVQVKRTTTPGVVAVTTMSGQDIGLLCPGGASPANKPTYTLMVNGAAASNCTSTGGAQTDQSTGGNAVGGVVYFGGTATPVSANAEVTVVGHFTDNTDFPVWAGTLA